MVDPYHKFMPPINTIKQYVKDGYYHIYNRGVEKRNIFLDEQDYVVFLRFLKEYLLPENHSDLKKLQGINPRRKPKNFANTISLVAYCLMNNHFHLFLQQRTYDSMKNFMKAVATNYVMYFNRKYKRVGPLFQGIYKAALILDEPYFFHITRYIHRNPLNLTKVARDQPLHEYPYSSYRYFIGHKPPDWLHPQQILDLFSQQKINPLSGFKTVNSYQTFVEDHEVDEDSVLDKLRIDG